MSPLVRHVGWILLIVAGAGAMLLLSPQVLEAQPSVCPIHHFLGIECYGCGMLRAISRVIHGDLTAAIAHNRAVVVVLPLLMYVAAKRFGMSVGVVWRTVRRKH